MSLMVAEAHSTSISSPLLQRRRAYRTEVRSLVFTYPSKELKTVLYSRSRRMISRATVVSTNAFVEGLPASTALDRRRSIAARLSVALLRTRCSSTATRAQMTKQEVSFFFIICCVYLFFFCSTPCDRATRLPLPRRAGACRRSCFPATL